MGLSIRLLGRPEILDERGEQQAVRGLQSWALLARVLLSERELSRRHVAAELFPETIDPLGSLRWCLASLRRALRSAETFTGDPIKKNLPSGTKVDVHQIEYGDFDLESAGNLLDGLEPRCSAEFATWLLVARQRLASQIDARLRQETMQAIAVGKYKQAIRLAELGVRRQPFDEGAHILLVKSLSLIGSHDAAVAHVEATERAFIEELGEKPTAALRSAARRTISAPPGGVSPQAVVKSLLESGQAALAAGAADAGVDCLRRAAVESEKCNDSRLQGQVLLELGTALVHAVRGYDEEGAILLRQSVELAERCSNTQACAAGLRELGYIDALAGRRPTAAIYLAKALDVSDDADSLAGIHAVIGFNLVDWGKFVEGLEHFGLSLDYARSVQNPRREAWSLGIGSWGQLAAGRPEVADRWLDECLTIIESLRWVAFRPWPLALRAETTLQLKRDPPELVASLEEAFALSAQLGDPCWEAVTARALALTHAAKDDFESALHWINLARERCARETDAYAGLLVAILAKHVEISSRAGLQKQSESIARELLSLAARTHTDFYVQWTVEHIGHNSNTISNN